MNIFVRGFPPDTTSEEIKQAIQDFGAPVNKVDIQPSDDPDRYVAVIDTPVDNTGARVLAEKINGTVWKGKKLVAENMLF